MSSPQRKKQIFFSLFKVQEVSVWVSVIVSQFSLSGLLRPWDQLRQLHPEPLPLGTLLTAVRAALLSSDIEAELLPLTSERPSASGVVPKAKGGPSRSGGGSSRSQLLFT